MRSRLHILVQDKRIKKLRFKWMPADRRVETHTMPLFFLPGLSSYQHSWIRGAHIMQKVNKQLIKVTCSWRKPPSRSSRPRSHCLYDSLSHVLAPRAIYLPLVFVFPASNVSFLLPLNHSVNFQKPVKSPHWPHGGGGGGVKVQAVCFSLFSSWFTKLCWWWKKHKGFRSHQFIFTPHEKTNSVFFGFFTNCNQN